MPELPEVETIRRGLAKSLTGRKIQRIKILNQKSFRGDPALAVGWRIKSWGRRGKMLLVFLENGKVILIHLRMTGQLVWAPKNADFFGVKGAKNCGAPAKMENWRGRIAGGHPSENYLAELPNAQTRVIWELGPAGKFGGNSAVAGKLFFNDQRKFGFMQVVDVAELKDEPFLRKLAPEPWGLTAVEFVERLKRHQKTTAKAALLNQSVIAGVGNIYADEALWRAKIWPERKVVSLSEEEIARLLAAVREVMEQAIAAGGSSLRNYVRADGTRGDYLKLFAQAYGRTGEVCRRCGGKIDKIRVAGRGTYVCRKCQV